MMWEACAEKMKALGGRLEMGCRVTGCSYDETCGSWTVEYKDDKGESQRIEAEHIISSAPMRELDLRIVTARERADEACCGKPEVSRFPHRDVDLEGSAGV